MRRRRSPTGSTATATRPRSVPTTTHVVHRPGLPPGTSHTYTVDAVDSADNPSVMSAASASITVIGPPDTQSDVPGRPTGSSPSPNTIQIHLDGVDRRLADHLPDLPRRATTSIGTAPPPRSSTRCSPPVPATRTPSTPSTPNNNASAKSLVSASITVQAAPAAGLQPRPRHTRIAYDVVRTDIRGSPPVRSPTSR